MFDINPIRLEMQAGQLVWCGGGLRMASQGRSLTSIATIVQLAEYHEDRAGRLVGFVLSIPTPQDIFYGPHPVRCGLISRARVTYSGAYLATVASAGRLCFDCSM
jgi:hypothetical protein